jgi:hypothetical protein
MGWTFLLSLGAAYLLALGIGWSMLKLMRR